MGSLASVSYPRNGDVFSGVSVCHTISGLILDVTKFDVDKLTYPENRL